MTSLKRLLARIPWKQVAIYMADRGAYKYGNATVKKKYLEIIARMKAQVVHKANKVSVTEEGRE